MEPITLSTFELLSQCQNPSQLKALNPSQLRVLCEELRHYLIHILNEVGGHFAASLGVVELTVALHYLFDTPNDRLVWDVGHQAYIHKILTERAHLFKTLRKMDGISGFPSRSESEYDTFGVGHSSTSISAALGMACASAQFAQPRKTVAIIGDGALTAGMAFEALNHAGALATNLLVILNENGISISPNVGALAKTMRDYTLNPLYQSMQQRGKQFMPYIPGPLQTIVRRTKQHVDELLLPGAFFHELGFAYTGPIDGHDLTALLDHLSRLKDQSGPQLLHIQTQKGKGFAPAEVDPVKYHAVSAGFLQLVQQAAPQTDTVKASSPTRLIVEQPQTPPPTYSDIFSQWLCDMAQQDSRLVAITAATREGSGLIQFSQQFADRYYDVGIAEQHCVTFAAGLACEGAKPVVAMYSTFLQRAYDQVIHDVALQNLPVLFAIDRAGLVGADGPTHAGSFDLSFLRCIPNFVIMVPANANECRQMLYSGFLHSGPAAVRYLRGQSTDGIVDMEMQAIPIGKGKIIQRGKKIAILNFGSLYPIAAEVATKLQATLVNMRFVKPLDIELIHELANSHELLVTIEENVVQGGAGSAVNEYIHQADIQCKIRNFGLPDRFLPQGERSHQLAWSGLTAVDILTALGLSTSSTAI